MTTMAEPRGVAPKLRSNHERLLQILVETQSFKFSDTPSFPLASGVLSRYYVDCKVGLSYPQMRHAVGQLMNDRITATTLDAVGGLVIGAYPIAIAVSDAAFLSGRELRAFVVRKEAKEHGLKKLIEGDVRSGDRVLIVDDVITSGKSTIEAIQKSRDFGLDVLKAIAIIDRQEQNGRQNIEALGVPVEALCTLQDLCKMREDLIQRER